MWVGGLGQCVCWDGFKISSLGPGTTQVDMWLSSPTGYRYWSSFLNICGDGLSNLVCVLAVLPWLGKLSTTHILLFQQFKLIWPIDILLFYLNVTWMDRQDIFHHSIRKINPSQTYRLSYSLDLLLS